MGIYESALRHTHEVLLDTLRAVVVQAPKRHLSAHVSLLGRVLVVLHQLLVRLCDKTITTRKQLGETKQHETPHRRSSASVNSLKLPASTLCSHPPGVDQLFACLSTPGSYAPPARCFGPCLLPPGPRSEILVLSLGGSTCSTDKDGQHTAPLSWLTTSLGGSCHMQGLISVLRA